MNPGTERLTHNPSCGHFDVFMVEGEERPLVAFFVNQKLGKQNIKVTGRGPYHATIRVLVNIENQKEELTIHNIYNPNDTGGARHREGRYEGLPIASCLPMLEAALEKHKDKHQIVVGDFNMHHNRWSGQRDLRSNSTRQTEFTIEMMERWGLDLCLEQGTITSPPSDIRSSRGSTIDLVWATEEVQNMIRSCGIEHDLDYASDHLPITTALEYSLIEAPKTVRHKFKELNVEQFTSKLQRELSDYRSWPLASKKDLDWAVDKITSAIQNMIQTVVPKSVVCARSIPGFTDECREAIDEVKHTQRRWKRHPTEDNLREFQEAKRVRAKAISRANRDSHREKASEVKDEKSLWSLARWARNRSIPKAAFTPDLKDR